MESVGGLDQEVLLGIGIGPLLLLILILMSGTPCDVGRVRLASGTNGQLKQTLILDVSTHAYHQKRTGNVSFMKIPARPARPQRSRSLVTSDRANM